MVKNHAHHTFKPKYLFGLQGIKTLNDSTLVLITPNGIERNANINDIKSCRTMELTENAWDSFLSSIQTKCRNCNYNLRPQPNPKI